MKNKQKKFDDLKYIPTGSYWKRVLLEIYKHAPHNYGESNEIGFYENSHFLAKKLKITGYELGLAISFLGENKLIDESNGSTIPKSKSSVPKWSNRISLTEKGFEVASKLENQLSNQKLQKWIVLFTGIIMWTGVSLFIKDIFNWKNTLNLGIYIFGGLIFIFFFIYSEIIKENWRKFIWNRQIKKEKTTI